MNIIVKKAEIVNSLFLKYSFKQSNIDSEDNLNVNSNAPIHEDLRRLFRLLIPHFCFICEEITDEDLVRKALAEPETYLLDKDAAPDDSFFGYRIFSFEIKNDKGAEFLTLAGAKQLSSGDEIYFSTPPMVIGDMDYKFCDDMAELIARLRAEVEAYMQGKHAPKVQVEMEVPEGEGEEGDGM